ncbi:MAG: hypothetical protein G4V63_16850 [Candidatus Afipia apatlaquensis]|uniref:Uncharacterized protein n=1 Tax=Candidatus Afipia apatlaquensis TaxID=2712852 RepID=A0A7C9RKB5_9BRAD|nr:hypothetical protein [Candidatus Afipia apatlaquensis]
MNWQKIRNTLSAPLEWTADQVKARPKAFLIVWTATSITAFILGARWF